MTKQITPREWEAISAYLDGQLSPKEQTRLEARLKGDSDLQTALNDMRRTRAMIRSQARLRAPRNFTLTPEMARVRPTPRVFPMLRLASALAGILFVLVLIGDLFTGAPNVPSMAYAPGEAGVMAVQEAPAEGVGGEIENEFDAMPEARQAFTATVQGTAQPGDAMSAMIAPEEPAAEANGEEPEVLLAPAPSLPPAAMEAYPPPNIASKDFSSEDTQLSDSPEVSELRAYDRLTWRVLEVVLLGIALVAGLAAFYLRRVRGG